MSIWDKLAIVLAAVALIFFILGVSVYSEAKRDKTKEKTVDFYINLAGFFIFYPFCYFWLMVILAGFSWIFS